jgi:Zn finger protein HypA/HybF involved in hydrogenase expression
MHEMGIASSVLEAVDQELHRQPGCRATRVGLRIGEYAAVDQDSLRFAFEVLAKDANRIPVDLTIDFRLASDDLAIAFIEFDDEAANEATV